MATEMLLEDEQQWLDRTEEIKRSLRNPNMTPHRRWSLNRELQATASRLVRSFYDDSLAQDGLPKV